MATEAQTLQVELIHAPEAGEVWRETLELSIGASISDALRLSGFARQFPQMLEAGTPLVGIFGQSCPAERVLADGDRIEIYRPLRFDPMESRRRRAEHKRKAQARTQQRGQS